MYLDFKRNLCTEERIIRATVGLLTLKLSGCKEIPKQQSNFLKVFSLSLFIDSLLSYCLLNDIMGWSKKEDKSEKKYYNH